MTRRGPARRGGFTLLEVTISLAVSSMVLLAAAGLAFAVSHAWSASNTVSDVVSHGRGGLLVLSQRIRSARAVGYTDGTTMLVWREDDNGDGYPNQSELSIFTLSNNTLTEGRFVFPANLSAGTRDANDARVTAANFISSTYVASLRTNAYHCTGTLAEYVSSLSWTLDQAVPQTRMVQVQLSLTKDGQTQTFCTGMALRSPLGVN